MDRQANLLELIGALGAPRRLAGRLHRRQEQPDQDRDDRDHDQELDQGKGARVEFIGLVLRHRSHWPSATLKLACSSFMHRRKFESILSEARARRQIHGIPGFPRCRNAPDS